MSRTREHPPNAIEAGSRGVEFTPRPARRPTAARPGTRQKVQVFLRRIARGEELWHPDDPVLRHATQVQIGRLYGPGLDLEACNSLEDIGAAICST